MDNYNQCDIVKMMGDLSSQSGDLYALWIKRFIAYVGGIDTVSVDIHAVDLIKLAQSVNYAKVTEWLGVVKSVMPSRGKSSFQSARNAVNWLARLLVSFDLLDSSLPALLSTLPLPRAESGQHPGKWLNYDELNILIMAVQTTSEWKHPRRTRNLVIIGLMALGGLRCSEVA